MVPESDRYKDIFCELVTDEIVGTVGMVIYRLEKSFRSFYDLLHHSSGVDERACL